MRKKVLRVLVPGIFLVAALALAACGSDGSSSDSTSSGTADAQKQYAAPTEAPSDAQSGGDLTVIAASDVDYIDPGAAYYQWTFMIDAATQSPLEAYAPADIAEPTPLLATDKPEISDDGKTVTYTLNSGVMFSPPVSREVTSADVKYAIERALLPGVPNGYIQTYLAGVEGIDKAVKEAQDNPTGGAPDISGITTPDDQTLEIKLTNTTAAGVTGALTLPVSSPVPEEYAKKFDADNPSTYGENQVATGPYMIENACVAGGKSTDKCDGSLTGYTPNKEIHLVRNPNWGGEAGSPPDWDFRPAYLDEVNVQEGFADTVSASKKVLAGNAMVNGDFTTPPSAIKQAVQSGEDGQLTLTAERWQPLRLAEHAEAAVRRHQRPQGRDREQQPDRPPQHPRRRVDRTGGFPLPAAGLPRLRAGRWPRGSRPRLHGEPGRRSGARRGVHEEGRVLERQVRGLRLRDHHGR